MEWIEYKYKFAIIGISAISQTIAKNVVWKPQLKINGAVQVPAYGFFEKKFFDTTEKAIDYAKKAGELIVDGGVSGEIPEEIL